MDMKPTPSLRLSEMDVKPTPSRRRASFFKVLLADFTQGLRIPPAFVKHFRGHLPVKFVLRSSNGRCWHVEVKRIANFMFFKNGWQEFVKENLLEIGDILVFGYDGDKEFDVKIFGRSACEKEDASAERKCDECILVKKEEQEEEEGKFVGQTGGCRCKSYLYRAGKMVPSSKTRCWRVQSEQRPAPGITADHCPFKMKHPHFVAIYSGKRYRMSIPVIFVKENRMEQRQYVYLHDHNGKAWKVNLVYRTDGRRLLGGGWCAFAREHNLDVGDICCLEFIRGKGRGVRRIIRIHIFRASE